MDITVHNLPMSRGRPVEFCRKTAIEAAIDVFWRQGYEATSLQDLLAAMDLSKSSFYQAFGSKQQLFETCLEHYREARAKAMRRALMAAPSGLQFLGDFLRGVASEARTRSKPKGCLIMNTATEFSGREPSISDQVELGVWQFAEVFKAAIERSQAEGEIPSGRDSEVLARYVVSSVSGLRTMVKAGASAEVAEEIADVALQALS